MQNSEVKVVEGYVYLHGRITQGQDFLKEKGKFKFNRFLEIINWIF